MFPSHTNLDKVCMALATRKDQASVDALALIQEMDKCLMELASVAPAFPCLVLMLLRQINDNKKPGEELLEKLEIVVADIPGSDRLVPHHLVPTYSKPYLEILRLYVSLRRREATANYCHIDHD
jgi:hypothetical protein